MPLIIIEVVEIAKPGRKVLSYQYYEKPRHLTHTHYDSDSSQPSKGSKSQA